jgi:hypothetical protein
MIVYMLSTPGTSDCVRDVRTSQATAPMSLRRGIDECPLSVHSETRDPVTNLFVASSGRTTRSATTVVRSSPRSQDGPSPPRTAPVTLLGRSVLSEPGGSGPHMGKTIFHDQVHLWLRDLLGEDPFPDGIPDAPPPGCGRR